MNSLLLNLFALLVLIAVALLTKRTSQYKANAFLASAYIFLAYSAFYSLLFESGKMQLPRFLVHSNLIFFYLSFPCVYFYLVLTTGSKVSFRLRNAVHLLPAFLGLIYYTYYQIAGPVSEKVWSTWFLHPMVETLIHFLGLAIWMFYLLLSIRFIMEYNRKISLLGFTVHREHVIWLKTFLPLFIVPCFIQYLSVIGLHITARMDTVSDILLLVSLSFLFVKQFHFIPLFFNNKKRKDNEHKYGASALSSEQLDILSKKLTKIMESPHPPYLSSSVSIETIADLMNISTHKLSQVVNEGFEINFSQYMNHYRIKEALKHFDGKDGTEVKIEWVADKCGFSNRINFCNAFKLLIGSTPEEYVEKIRKKKR